MAFLFSHFSQLSWLDVTPFQVAEGTSEFLVDRELGQAVEQLYVQLQALLTDLALAKRSDEKK